MINTKLLRKIQAHILEEPRRFIMERLIQLGKEGERVRDYAGSVKLPSCGTAACIAGWALVLSGKNKKKIFNGSNYDAHLYSADTAEAILRLTYNEASRLFYLSAWPSNFEDDFFKAKTPKQRAKVAVARIDHFINTKGAE